MPVNQKTQVVKIRPYPIEVLVTPEKGEAYRASIMKVTLQGVFIEGQVIYPLGAKIHVQFELPVLKYFVNEDVVVRKMYDQFVQNPAPGQPKVKRLIECHFVGLDPESKQKIFSFTKRINQKD